MTPAAIAAMIKEGEHLVPYHLLPGLVRYFMDRVLPGDFLAALLRNDLMKAVGHADDTSFAALPRLCQFLHNFAPPQSFGSSAAVTAWLSKAAS